METFDSDTLYGQHVKDADGATLGPVEAVYADDDTGAPAWIAVSPGLVSSRLSIVPLGGATYDENGHLRVPFGKGQIKDAPRVDADGNLTTEVERELYAYYGVAPGTPAAGDATRAAQAPSVEPTAADDADAASGGPAAPAEDQTGRGRSDLPLEPQPGAVRSR